MATWTPVSAPSSNWGSQNSGVFSPLTFSKAAFDSKEVFAIGVSSLVWSNASAPNSNWTAA
jgi:hypothetical protein